MRVSSVGVEGEARVGRSGRGGSEVAAIKRNPTEADDDKAGGGRVVARCIGSSTGEEDSGQAASNIGGNGGRDYNRAAEGGASVEEEGCGAEEGL